MPTSGPCPFCKRKGFLRFETVISKGNAHRSFYCGACNRTWNTDEKGNHLTRHSPPERSRQETKS